MLRLVVLISGTGSNLQAILDACGQNPANPPATPLNARVVGVFSNKAEAAGLQRARACGVPVQTLSHAAYPDRDRFDQAMSDIIAGWQPDLVVLAGFMRILSAGFVQHHAGRLINVHPSLLPKFKGMHTHQRALEAGETEHGCSVHFVTPELDGGPVIAQGVVRVESHDTPETLAARVHAVEHRVYPAVIGLIADGRLTWHPDHLRLDGAVLREPVRG